MALIHILQRRGRESHLVLKRTGAWHERRGYVYLVWFGYENIYKIGKAEIVAQRFTQIGSVEAPFEFQVQHTIQTDDAFALESSLHDHFAPQRLRGEWFRLSSADIALIKSMQAVYFHDPIANGDTLPDLPFDAPPYRAPSAA